jgi:choline dehydrogenase
MVNRVALTLLLLLRLGAVFCLNYDYIVYGGGTAGCVAAERLSRNGDTVFVIEEGLNHEDEMTPRVGLYGHIWSDLGGQTENYAPLAPYLKTIQSTEEAFGFKHQNIYQPITLGGASAVNGNGAGRPSRVDMRYFNSTLWNYDTPAMKQTFKDLETFEPCATPGGQCYFPNEHGTSGPLIINTTQPDPLLAGVGQIFAALLNLPWNNDSNSGITYGQSVSARNIQTLADGSAVRQDTWTRILKPAVLQGRVDFGLASSGLRLIPMGNGRHMVEYIDDEYNKISIRANKDVIFAAGAIGTPTLMQRSGMGDPLKLASLGIPVTVDNPNIGLHLADQASARMVHMFLPGGPVNNGSILMNYYRSAQYQGPPDGTDVEVDITTLKMNDKTTFFQDVHILTWQLTHNTHYKFNSSEPESGFVEIKSPSYAEPPRVQLNLYENEDNLDVMVEMVKKIRQTVNLMPPLPQAVLDLMQPYFPFPLSANGFIEQVPGYLKVPPGATDDQIKAWLREAVQPELHYTGSTAMHKVVDERCRLIDRNGQVIPGIRVVGASIIPRPLETHSNAYLSAVTGSRCAQFALEDNPPH